MGDNEHQVLIRVHKLLIAGYKLNDEEKAWLSGYQRHAALNTVVGFIGGGGAGWLIYNQASNAFKWSLTPRVKFTLAVLTGFSVSWWGSQTATKRGVDRFFNLQNSPMCDAVWTNLKQTLPQHPAVYKYRRKELDYDTLVGLSVTGKSGSLVPPTPVVDPASTSTSSTPSTQPPPQQTQQKPQPQQQTQPQQQPTITFTQATHDSAASRRDLETWYREEHRGKFKDVDLSGRDSFEERRKILEQKRRERFANRPTAPPPQPAESQQPSTTEESF